MIENRSRRQAAPIAWVKRSLPKPTIVFDTYWKFACERQKVFFRRLNGTTPPWTSDPILSVNKFTNAYRASDRVSQFLIKEVICSGPQDLRNQFFRILLFKIFNKIETWNSLKASLGEVSWESFKPQRYDNALNKLMEAGRSVYSAAYIMPSGGKNLRFPRKHTMHLHLLNSMMKDQLDERIHQAVSMKEAFELLRSYPTMGDFLAYQFATDLNYSSHSNFSEMDFVVPGPGAKDGIRKCFSSLGDYNESDLIRWVTERQSVEFDRLGLNFESLWGRPLQLIDCQNIFCETDKYSRVAHPEFKGRTGRAKIKQKFASTKALPDPFYPPKWGLNELIARRQPLKRKSSLRQPEADV